MMNSKYKYIWLIALFSLLIQCKKDEINNNAYPRLITLPVTEISAEGARFNAEILNKGDFEIISYGFVWNLIYEQNLENANRVILSGNIPSERFTEKVETSLQAGRIYFVRAFIQTEEYMVYGTDVSFISLGSKAPEVHSFSPTAGTWGDTISISGTNFSYIKENIKVEFGELEADIISSTDSTISVIVPANNLEDLVSLKVSILGNSSEANMKFNYLIPSIHSVSPLQITFGDTITLTGENFGDSLLWNEVFISNTEAEIVFVSKTEN